MIEAANLACIHKQIHSEFGILFILRGNLTLKVKDLNEFLHHFFVRYPSSALKDVRLYMEAEVDMCSSYSLNMLAVVSVLREHPLLEIEWSPGCWCADCLGSYVHCTVAFSKCLLTDMVARHSRNLISAKLSHEEFYGSVQLLMVTEKGVSRQTVEEWELTCWKGSILRVTREGYGDFEDFELMVRTAWTTAMTTQGTNKSESGSETKEQEQEILSVACGRDMFVGQLG